jgi:putative SOS response-associated peptidase YedK
MPLCSLKPIGSNTMATLQEEIHSINERLRSLGNEAIQVRQEGTAQEDDGTVIESCAIITTEANAQIRPIHERMPVILNEEYLPAWLDPGPKQHTLLAMLTPCAAPMVIHPVSSKVNNPRHNGPDCVVRISTER